ncbi:sterol-4-alpha-carboxylate 3-dehydrogenase, decarboxylating-like isoform X2 [Dermacentor andersoni]|uniref:sterol-4-alpha-carboxylate 3-dehydrogenase, decarboxylating-like isoform X2 n=1 Tax=Dermacentor andersoni TaxID=34620 RepID=UPI003B3A58EF
MGMAEGLASSPPTRHDDNRIAGTHRPFGVVLVTGSSGLLGHHVVRELQSHPGVQEVRLFDSRPFENGMGHPITKTMKHVVANVCDKQAVREAMKGVDAVIHCASLIPTTLIEDAVAMERVNVQGTRNVVDACLEESVQYLVYTGSVGVIQDGATRGHEGLYAETKAQAEKLVCDASGSCLKDGLRRLHTIVIRLPLMYGELDHRFIPSLVTWSKRTFNVYFRLGTVFPMIYAGNAASVHVHALEAMCEDSTLSGRCIAAVDDTPVDSVASLSPLVAGHGIHVSRRPVPYPLAIAFALCITGIARVLAPLFPGVRDAVLPKPADVRYMYRGTFFDRSEAKEVLAWRPKYPPQEAVQMSRSFYDAL